MAKNKWRSTPKLVGMLAPVFALRHADDLGTGDTIAVIKALEFCRRRRIGLFQTLPINEPGFDNSPYGAISSLAIDPLTIAFTPAMVPGLSPVHLAELDQRQLAELRTGSVNYPEVRRLKHKLLRLAFENYLSRPGKRNDFLRFHVENQDWLPQYTLFRAIMERQASAEWQSWPAELRDFASAEHHFKDDDAMVSERLYFEYVQWVADRQWRLVRKRARELGVLMMGDVPFGVSINSADVWAWQNLFDLRWCGGAPPEPFFKVTEFVRLKGQNWGIAVYNWLEHKREEYEWWRRRLTRAGRFFDFNRFDHILGVFRIYGFPWLPSRNEEFTYLDDDSTRALTGGLIPQFLPRADDPAESAALNASEGVAILRQLKRAAARAGSALAGEDLGCVPDYVRPALRKLGIPGFSIPMWRRHDDQSFMSADSIPELSIAAYTTHDHPPLAKQYAQMVERWVGPNGHEGWLEMRRLMDFLGMDQDRPPVTFTDQVLEAHWRQLLGCPAVAAILMVSDILGTTHQFNEPGTESDSNWSKRLDKELAQYEIDEQFGPRLDAFTRLIVDTGRCPF